MVHPFSFVVRLILIFQVVLLHFELVWSMRFAVGADVYVEIFNGPDGRPSGVG